jgi:hypothetical protein
MKRSPLEIFMDSQIQEQNARSIAIVCDNAKITRLLSVPTLLSILPSNSIKDTRWQSNCVRSNKIQSSCEMNRPQRSPLSGDSSTGTQRGSLRRHSNTGGHRTLSPCNRCHPPIESFNTCRWEQLTHDKNPSCESIPRRPQKKKSFVLPRQSDLPKSLRNKAPCNHMERSNFDSLEVEVRSTELVLSSVESFDKIQEREDTTKVSPSKTAESACSLSPSLLLPPRCKSEAARGA